MFRCWILYLGSIWIRQRIVIYFLPIFKNDRKDPWVYSFSSVPRRVMEQLILKTISRHMKAEKVIRSSQHGLTKGKSCLSYPAPFCDEISSWGKSSGYCLYLNFTAAFNTLSCKILIGVLLIAFLWAKTVRWLETQLNGCPRVWRSVACSLS